MKILGLEKPSIQKSQSSQSFFKKRVSKQRSSMQNNNFYQRDNQMMGYASQLSLTRTISPTKDAKSAKMVMYPKQYNRSFYPKSNHERKIMQIEKPYTDLEKNNEKHRENLTQMNFHRRLQSKSMTINRDDPEQYSSKKSLGSNSIFVKNSQSEVQKLLQRTNQIIKSEKDYK